MQSFNFILCFCVQLTFIWISRGFLLSLLLTKLFFLSVRLGLRKWSNNLSITVINECNSPNNLVIIIHYIAKDMVGIAHIWEYCSNDPVEIAIAWIIVLGTICFLLTKLTNEFSWVDRLWSILPITIGFHYLYHQWNCMGEIPSLRQIVMLTLTLIWGVRLSYNFYRKGGYKAGGQDYRWKYIRQRYHWILVQLLNFFFIAYIQLFLLLWFASPIYLAKQTEFNAIDIILIIIWICLFLGQSIADNQQWLFQKEKYRMLKQAGNDLTALPYPYRQGFISDGLFRFSRHPNFFCQISMWWVMFFFSVNSVGLNLSGIGTLSLTFLFLGSTTLTEANFKLEVPCL